MKAINIKSIAVLSRLFLFLISGLITCDLMAATVVLNPVKDNTIFQNSDSGDKEYSCGAGDSIFSGRTKDGYFRRALLKFDIVGNIPVGATINSVSLSLQINRTQDTAAATMALHPVTQDWGEGGIDCIARGDAGKGSEIKPEDGSGHASWISAKYQQVLWTTPGGDFGAASASASASVSKDNNAFGIWDSTLAGNTVMATDVQNWLDAPSSNHGWILIGNENPPAQDDKTARRFNSRENTNSKPTLTIDFTTAVESSACCFVNGDCSITDNTTCTSQGGTPDASLTCSPNPCPQPTGACCNFDQTCSDNIARDVCETAGGTFQGGGVSCDAVSCGLEPFVDALPIPGVLAPIGTRPDGAPKYEVAMTQVQQQLHRDLPLTDVWAYAGSYPGPTIEATSNQPVEVKYINNLPPGSHYLDVDTCSHGPNYYGDSKRVVPHLHGGHVPARYDGQPEYDFLPGEFDIYEYPNKQLPATLWYHDHALGITRLNVYMGLAGYYIVRDDLENALPLPSGEFEVPLVIQDRKINTDGSLFYPSTIQNQFLGDVALANGKVWPFMNVKQGKYRFRMLNGSQARVYDLRLENSSDPGQVIPFNLIGTDGGLIDAPIPLGTIQAAPAERFDVVIDFSAFAPGTEIILRNDEASSPLLPNIMKFIVTADPGFTGSLPMTLRTVAPIPESSAAGTRRFLLERVTEACAGNEWLIKSLDASGNVIGEHWDDITETPILGETEIWQFENPSNMMHPMHVHLVMFQVLDKFDLTTGAPIPLEPWEINTWKDTVQVPPNTKVRVIMKFEDYTGKFAYHCHILDHEDHEMMRQFQTTHDPSNCNNNGVCEIGEDCISCVADCGVTTGASCGNGLCEAGDGENCLTCPSDCAGNQEGSGEKFCCGGNSPGGTKTPIDCGVDTSDNRCIDATQNRFCRLMPRVSACCGDALCEGGETSAACGADCADFDIDTVPDVIDWDDDNDGVADTNDAFPFDPAETTDTDGDGFGNNIDPDDDNDGFQDVDEQAAGTDPLDSTSYAPDGDMNMDGEVNAGDLIYATRAILGSFTPTQQEINHADAAPLVGGVPTPDGQLTTGDLVVLTRKVLGTISF